MYSLCNSYYSICLSSSFLIIRRIRVSSTFTILSSPLLFQHHLIIPSSPLLFHRHLYYSIVTFIILLSPLLFHRHLFIVISSPLLFQHHLYYFIITIIVISSALLFLHRFYYSISTFIIPASPLLLYHYLYYSCITFIILSAPLLFHLRSQQCRNRSQRGRQTTRNISLLILNVTDVSTNQFNCLVIICHAGSGSCCLTIRKCQNLNHILSNQFTFDIINELTIKTFSYRSIIYFICKKASA